jgi:Fe-Mn family superoxide dismutase
MAFEIPKLTYQFSDLEPHIDTRTMEIHYTKHHAAYTNNLNIAVSGTDMDGKTIENILINLDKSNIAVRNNGGGFYNHNLFWVVMSPSGGGKPTGELADSIDKYFGNFDEFKAKFAKVAATQFGSGWAWLCILDNGSLEVCGTANQDNPLMPEIGCGGTPILGLDVWEHAYYLNYQNRRPDYIEAFFNVINWSEVARRYAINK